MEERRREPPPFPGTLDMYRCFGSDKPCLCEAPKIAAPRAPGDARRDARPPRIIMVDAKNSW